jgi:tetratricopeptide (TPR) repeat protein
MAKMTTSARITGLALGFSAVLAIGAGHAAVTVFGGPGPAEDCFKAAKYGGPPSAGIDVCTQAIDTETMTDRDMAGTYVNRGVIYMAMASFMAAEHDFEQAIKLQPKMGEAIVNRGGALIAQKKYADGIAEISRGLELNPAEPEKAYFNRGLAYESLDDLKAAYYDYSKAAELKPGWDEPRAELSRFTVSQR